MNNSYQAKSGFKTFIFALIISLGLFGVFYYITSYSADTVDIETHSEVKVLGSDIESAFEKLAEEKMDTQPRYVLAGADNLDDLDDAYGEDYDGDYMGGLGYETEETTESTDGVPETGSVSITLAFMLSLTIISYALYTFWLGPRKVALSRFERGFFED